MVSSGSDVGGRDRWTIIAEPVAAVPVLGGGVDKGGRSGGGGGGGGRASFVPDLGPRPSEVEVPDLGLAPEDRPPFVGGWIASLRYELGGVIEPKAAREPGAEGEEGGPWKAVWFCCPAALVHDHKTGAWWHVRGPADAQLVKGGARPGWPTYQAPGGPGEGAPFSVGPVVSGTGERRFTRAVKIVLGHIADGDIYQVNLSHQLHAPFEGSSRALLRALLDRARPWYGAYLEYPLRNGRREAIASLSPEMFLSVSRDGRVTTRPMKGTAAPGEQAGRELRDSEKERAELTMIVDLMRSDLGRVCVPGSIGVQSPRDIEEHAGGTLLQATATVTGQLRPDATVGALLEATFPAGSVTGAPKVRAMQVINRLEREARGQYCGAVGFVSLCGNAAFNVAIRTASVVGPVSRGSVDAFERGSTLSYGVGAGIVADSSPDAEWRETLAKASVLLSVAGTVGVGESPIDDDDEF